MKVLVDEVKASAGLSRRTLSTDAGQSHDWVNTVIDGRAKDPGAVALAKMCEAHDYNVRWLITGLGPKLVDRRADFLAARERGEAAPAPTQDEIAVRLLGEGRKPRKSTP